MYKYLVRGDPKNPRIYLLKNCVFILTCLNFNHLQSILHLMQYTNWDFFPTAQGSFPTCCFWCLLVLLLFFCFTSSTSANHFSLRTFFFWENKSHLGWDQVNKEGRTWESCCFWSKSAEHSVQCGQVHSYIIHHEMGKHVERVFKKIHRSQTQPLTILPACTLIQMSSYNTPQVMETCTTRGPPSRR